MSPKLNHKLTYSGFTLVELLVVISIIAILSGIVALPFHDWQIKTNVEAQVRKMATDISEARVRALTKKQRQNFVLNNSSYLFQYYSSDDQPKCSGSNPGGINLPGMPINISYRLKKDATNYYAGSCSNVAGDTFEITTRGMLLGTDATVFFDYPGSQSASLDCLTIHTVRVNVGKKNGANCDDR